LGDDLGDGNAGGRPAEVGIPWAETILVIFQYDVIVHAGGEVDDGAIQTGSLVDPFVQ
jgi:hypothetical protein